MKVLITMKEFDEWLGSCPVPYTTSCSNDGLTELYEFDKSKLKDVVKENE